jgi:hypothetical protein
LQSHHLSKIKAQRSSSETLVKRSAPIPNRNGKLINGQPLFPNLISDLLADGHAVKFRAPGNSMYPTICDSDEVTVTPIDAASIKKGDIILYRNKSGVTAHRVIRITKKNANSHQNSELKPQSSASTSQSSDLSPQSCYILRGDAAIVFDDPVGADQILGKVTLVERKGRRIDPYALKATICFHARRLAARLKRHLCFQS